MTEAVWTLGPAMQTPGYGSGVVELDQVMPVFFLYGILLVLGLAIDICLLVRFVRQPAEWFRKINRLLWRPWGWPDLFFILFIIAALHLLILGVLQMLQLSGGLDGLDNVSVWIVAHSVVLHWAAIAIIGFRARQRGITWRVGFAHGNSAPVGDALQGLAAYVAIIPILLFYAAVYHVWLQWTGHEPAPQEVVRLFSEVGEGFMFYYFILLAVLVAPVAEEILFRGVLLPALGRRWGMGAAILVSSVLFAIIHFHIPSLVPLFVFSIALSLAYIYTETIVVPIVMHSLFNAVSLMVMLTIS